MTRSANWEPMTDEVLRCCRLLGVEPTVSPEELKRAYRNLVKQSHPDLFSDRPEFLQQANDSTKAFNLAYEYLLRRF